DYVLNPDDQTARVMKRGKRVPGGMGPEKMLVPLGAGPVMKFRARGANTQDSQVTTDSLRVQTMNGLQAQGKRVTRTIPAGQIGNAEPIVIVSEVWYSPDLQVVISSTQKDPRFGETDYQLTGINRAEPDASLFQV